jgi:hypothetical protein
VRSPCSSVRNKQAAAACPASRSILSHRAVFGHLESPLPSGSGLCGLLEHSSHEAAGRQHLVERSRKSQLGCFNSVVSYCKRSPPAWMAFTEARRSLGSTFYTRRDPTAPVDAARADLVGGANGRGTFPRDGAGSARNFDRPSDPEGVRRTLGEPERAGLRRQALHRLRANLALRTKLLKDGQVVLWSLTAWQTDAALASVRDRAALAKLADAERQEWQRHWADVAALVAADPLEQGRAHAAHGDWAKAADCYARAGRLPASDRWPPPAAH